MNVVFLEPMAGRNVLYLVGQVYDLPKAQAKRFIEHGICVEDSETVKEEIQVKQTVIGKQSKVSKKKAKK